jgi:hypothetical protein
MEKLKVYSLFVNEYRTSLEYFKTFEDALQTAKDIMSKFKFNNKEFSKSIYDNFEFKFDNNTVIKKVKFYKENISKSGYYFKVRNAGNFMYFSENDKRLFLNCALEFSIIKVDVVVIPEVKEENKPYKKAEIKKSEDVVLDWQHFYFERKHFIDKFYQSKNEEKNIFEYGLKLATIEIYEENLSLMENIEDVKLRCEELKDYENDSHGYSIDKPYKDFLEFLK